MIEVDTLLASAHPTVAAAYQKVISGAKIEEALETLANSGIPASADILKLGILAGAEVHHSAATLTVIKARTELLENRYFDAFDSLGELL